ncbi:MAG: hypothetical protein KAW12_02300 [Candidatus Aminicenantes bacterium]|nr:hypothetical protein [Candidatus Aminicenantes bacterium]
MAEKYYVMLMDVIGSTALPNRDEVTEKLNTAMGCINNTYDKDFLAPLEITRGDEVAGVLKTSVNTYNIITIFREALFPVDIRTILVYDILRSGLNSRRSSIIDGPAFQQGNYMMIRLKKTQKNFTLNTGQQELDRTIEALMNLVLWQWSTFTPLQQEIIRLYQEVRNQKEVAKQVERTQQQVQRTLAKCRWELIDAAEKAVKGLFLSIEKQPKKNRILK